MTILPLGDSTLLVQLGTAIDEETQKRVRAAFQALAAARIAGAHDIVPAYTSVAVHYDPLRVPASRAGEDEAPWQRMRRIIAHVLDGAAADPADAARRPTVEIPVLYGGEYGPDLEHVARHTRMSPDDVVSLHAAAEYRVCMIGFTPGFPYLAGLPPQLATPRRASPRTRVPAGSVGIAGTQTGVYPLSTPGGWQIIGRTDVQLFQPDIEPPTSLRLGDTVRFVPVRAP